MRLNVQSRGFSLTPALRTTVETEAREYTERFPELVVSLQVRLFDVNGARGGIDKGCLACARVGRGRATVVATDIDADLYRAIATAFSRLARATRSALGRHRFARSAGRWRPVRLSSTPGH